MLPSRDLNSLYGSLTSLFTEGLHIASREPGHTPMPTLQMGGPGSTRSSQTSGRQGLVSRPPASQPTPFASSSLGLLPDQGLTHSFLTQNPTVLPPKLEQALAVGVTLMQTLCQQTVKTLSWEGSLLGSEGSREGSEPSLLLERWAGAGWGSGGPASCHSQPFGA